jgi:hypothetical protein
MLIKGMMAFLFFIFALGIHAQHDYAQAGPKGWSCQFRILEGPRLTPRLYNCYGRSLNSTRARAKARCAGIPYCIPGACWPLDNTPRNWCER